jgi:hypothetical protein
MDGASEVTTLCSDCAGDAAVGSRAEASTGCSMGFLPVLKLFESATRAFCRACGSATATSRLHNFLGGGCPKACPNVSSMEHFAAAFAAVRGDDVHGRLRG